MLAMITDSQRDYLGAVFSIGGFGLLVLAVFLWIDWTVSINENDNRGNMHPLKLISALIITFLVIGILVGTFFLIGADVRVTK